MSKDELLAVKLNMIYEQLFNINWKLEEMKLNKRKEKAKESKRFSEIELEEIHHQENDYWNLKEQKMREFNEYDRVFVQKEENNNE